MSGATTRREIIEDEALIWGKDYAANVELAKAKNKEFIASILELNDANLKLRASRNDKEFQANQKIANELGQKAITVWKEQNQAELALISTKRKNELATESTNKALIKERVLLTETNKQIKEQAREQLGLVSSYEKLNKARNEAQKRLADLLSAEKKNVAEVVVAQREFDKLDARVKAVDASIKNYSKNIGNYSSAFSGLGTTLRDLSSAFGIVTGLALFGTIVKDIYSVIRDFDRQLIAVGKTTNITGEDLKQFGREVVDLGDKLDGVTVDGLIQSAEVAGQLGVTGTQNILKFSTAIEKLKLTSNIISDEQVGQFAKFIEVSSDSFDNADRLASVITQLGNSFATTEAEVLANSTEIQKGIAVYETSAQGVLALGSATSTLGSEAEASRSAIQSTFKVINDAIATGKNLQQVLKLTGLTQKELSKQFNTDATGVFVKFVGGLAKAKENGENLSKVLEDVEITEKRAFTVIGALAANYDVLTSSVAQANEEYNLNKALNKEVEAASQSIASIVSDLRDKWEAYVLSTNDANSGTQALTKTLKFLRDNFKEIINFVLKFGAVFFTYIGVIKAYNFYIAASTALQTAWTAGQIRFALATGIGTKSILAQAEAAKAATVAQEGLNIATKATPWGLIIGLVSAAVVAYVAFNDTLSETEKRIKAVNDAQKKVQDSENFYISERDKNREKDFKAIEDEIALRRAKGENSKKLDEEEINRKIQIINAQKEAVKALDSSEIDRTKKQIEESDKRVAQMQKEYDEINSLALRNPFGESIKDKQNLLIDEKANNDALRATLQKKQEIYKSEYDKFKKLIEDLEKNNKLNDAKAQAELDKKAIEARKKRLKEIYDAEKKAADDLFKLQQFRLQVAIDTDKELLDNESASFDNRLEALIDSNQLIQAKLKEQAEYELRQLGKYNEDKGIFIRELSDLQINELIRTGATSKKLTSEQQLIYEKYQNSLTEATKKGQAEREKLIDSQANKTLKNLDLTNTGISINENKEIIAENEKYNKILEIAKDNFELIEQAKEAHERKLIEISNKYGKQRIQEDIKVYENILKNDDAAAEGSKLSTKKRKEFELELSNFKKELSELGIQNTEANNQLSLELQKDYQQKALDLEKEAHQRTIDLQNNLTQSIIDLTNTIFDARVAAIDAELDYWNNYYDEQINLAGNDARQKDLLEKEKAKKAKELEKERKKEMIKAAIFNRILKLAEIGMNLAVTISEINKAAAAMDFYYAFGLGSAGATYRAFQIPFAIGTAAAQSAAVLLSPLPKYKTGRKGGPEELAITGDGGVSEVITDKHGLNPILTPKVPTITHLKEDDIVWKNIDEYKKYLNKSALLSLKEDNKKVSDYSLMFANGIYDKELLEQLKQLNETTKNKKSSVVVNNNIDFGYQIWRMSNINWRR